MTTGDKIKARRKELGISAETLAAHLGVHPSTIYRYEKGDIEKCPIDILAPIAAVLNTTPANLMGWDESEDPLHRLPGGWGTSSYLVDKLLENPPSSEVVAPLVSYYTTTPVHTKDDEAILQAIHDSPGMRMMFSTSKNRTEDDIRQAAAIIEAFYRSKDGDE